MESADCVPSQLMRSPTIASWQVAIAMIAPEVMPPPAPPPPSPPPLDELLHPATHAISDQAVETHHPMIIVSSRTSQ